MEENQNEQPEYEILPDDYPKYDLSFKIIIIGNSGVGKSCLSVKATKNVFENNYLATVGFEFFNFNIKLGERVIRLQIWDSGSRKIYGVCGYPNGQRACRQRTKNIPGKAVSHFK